MVSLRVTEVVPDVSSPDGEPLSETSGRVVSIVKLGTARTLLALVAASVTRMVQLA